MSVIELVDNDNDNAWPLVVQLVNIDVDDVQMSSNIYVGIAKGHL